jgi:hypothetical protein
MLKNLDYSKKSLNLINKPNTPHNTTQYLTHNYSQGRNEKVIIPEVGQDDMNDEDMLVDYMNETDDYCIPGGSMIGKRLIKFYLFE